MAEAEADRRGPLVFLHVPKTGGTSLIATLTERFAPEKQFTDEGNITPALLRWSSPLLDAESLVYGHAHHDVLALLPGARLATVLRAPVDQAISNYLFIRRNHELRMHADAVSLPFDQFMRQHWQCLVFQAISLDVAQSRRPVPTRLDFFRRLPAIQALLDRIDHVGCLERLDDFLGVLAAANGWTPPRPAPRLNLAGESDADEAEIASLRIAYQALWDEGALAPLLAAEAGLYGRAQRIAEAQAAAMTAAIAAATAASEPATSPPPAAPEPAPRPAGLLPRLLSRRREG